MINKTTVVREDKLRKDIKKGLDNYLKDIVTVKELIQLHFFMNTLTTKERNSIIRNALIVDKTHVV